MKVDGLLREKHESENPRNNALLLLQELRPYQIKSRWAVMKVNEFSIKRKMCVLNTKINNEIDSDIVLLNI